MSNDPVANAGPSGLQTPQGKEEMRPAPLTGPRGPSKTPGEPRSRKVKHNRQEPGRTSQSPQPLANDVPLAIEKLERKVVIRTDAGSDIKPAERTSFDAVDLPIPTKTKAEGGDLLDPINLPIPGKGKALQSDDWVTEPDVASWNHESESSRSGRPSTSFSTPTKQRAPPSRRPNPKAVETRKASQEASAAMSPKARTDWKPRAHVQDAGTLFRISDAVPYLLGPGHYLEVAARLRRSKISEASVVDDNGNPIVDPSTVTALDRVLLLVLTYLWTPVEKRPDVAAKILERFTTFRNHLVVYKDLGGNVQPRLTAIDYREFVGMMVGWERVPNPALVAEDRPDAVTPWDKIAPMLHKRRIPIQDVDRGLYEDLIMMSEPLLGITLDSLAGPNALQKSKQSLPAKPKAAAKRRRKAAHVMMPTAQDSTGLYTMRFTQKHPKGYVFDPSKEPYDMNLSATDPEAQEQKSPDLGKQEKPSIKDKIKAPLKRWARRFAKSRYGKWTKWTLITLFAVGIVALILCIVYFKIGQKHGRPLGEN